MKVSGGFDLPININGIDSPPSKLDVFCGLP